MSEVNKFNLLQGGGEKVENRHHVEVCLHSEDEPGSRNFKDLYFVDEVNIFPVNLVGGKTERHFGDSRERSREFYIYILVGYGMDLIAL